MDALTEQKLDQTEIARIIDEARDLEAELSGVSLDNVRSCEQSSDLEVTHGLLGARELLRLHPWVAGLLPVCSRTVCPPTEWVRTFLRTRTDLDWSDRSFRGKQLECYIQEGKEALSAYRRLGSGSAERTAAAVAVYEQLSLGVSPEELCFNNDAELIQLISEANDALLNQ